MRLWSCDGGGDLLAFDLRAGESEVSSVFVCVCCCLQWTAADWPGGSVPTSSSFRLDVMSWLLSCGAAVPV